MDKLISLQAAIDALVKRTGLEWDNLKIIHPMFCILEDLPSAQPERKRGRWMLSKMYESDHVAMICSECGATYDKTVAGCFFNYCPNCGADMRGERND